MASLLGNSFMVRSNGGPVACLHNCYSIAYEHVFVLCYTCRYLCHCGYVGWIIIEYILSIILFISLCCCTSFLLLCCLLFQFIKEALFSLSGHWFIWWCLTFTLWTKQISIISMTCISVCLSFLFLLLFLCYLIFAYIIFLVALLKN